MFAHEGHREVRRALTAELLRQRVPQMSRGVGAPPHFAEQCLPLLARPAIVLPLGARMLSAMIEELHVLAFEGFDVAFDEVVEFSKLALNVRGNGEIHRASFGARPYHDSSTRAQATRSLLGEQMVDGIGEGVTERRVLLGVEVDTVNDARGGHGRGIKEAAVVLRGDLFVGVGPADASVLSALKFWRDRSLGSLDWGRRHDQDLGDWHIRFNRRATDGAYERGQSLRGMPRRVLVRELEIVSAEHDDDERQR